MQEIHVLVDFENVQPTMEELAKLVPGLTDAWLFHGPHQAKQAQSIAAAHSHVTLVPRSGQGKNALDFHLSFYLGYVAAKHPDAQLAVVANDKGYDPMIAHAKLLGFTAKRVGYKAKPAPVAKAAPAKKTVAVKVAAPVKKAAAPAAPAKVAAKKAVAKKVATQKAPAVKVPPPKAPAKKAAAKTLALQKVAAKKTPAKKSPASAKAKPATPVPAAVPCPEGKTFTRIQKGLLKMGDKAPHKLKPFLRHVGALLGKGSTAEQIDAVVAKLEKAGSVRVAGDLVLYTGK
jgi:Rieske Fe-S protein